MSYTFSCLRCGQVLTGDDPNIVASEMVVHARVEHAHTLTHEHALAHLARGTSGHVDH